MSAPYVHHEVAVQLICSLMSRSKIMDLVVPYFHFSFYFIFDFSIFRMMELGLEVIGHTVTSVTFDGVVTTLITGLKRRK